MGSNKKVITDVYYKNTCSVCGNREINKYYKIDDNFIKYNDEYFPIREILSDALDLHIDGKKDKSMEICLDCKDKVVKFYHFKQKVKEAQESKKNHGFTKIKLHSKEKRSKIVHNIYQIIENYTRNFAIAKIKVLKNSKRMIIESTGKELQNIAQVQVNSCDEEEINEEDTGETDIFTEAIMIKEEPQNVSPLKITNVRKVLISKRKYSSDSSGSISDSLWRDSFNNPSTSKNPKVKKFKKSNATFKKEGEERVTAEESPETLENFQNNIFTKAWHWLDRYYTVVSINYSPEEIRRTKLKKTEFSKVRTYRAECETCKKKISTHVSTAHELIRHLKIHDFNHENE